MPELLWVHAFRRDTVDDAGKPIPDEEAIVRVLREGPQVHPDSANDTRVHEGRLQITPPRVYAYVGRTKETFGENALVLPRPAISGGELSPFDTGGMIKKIAPVASYDDSDKAAYVAAFTWKIPDDVADCLAKYPTADPKRIADYLETAKPDRRGPGEVWPKGRDEPIWEANSDWRAWTWEGRAEPGHIRMADLQRWTCSPSIEREVFATATRLYKSRDRAFLLRMNATYLEGGVGSLLVRLRKDQAA